MTVVKRKRRGDTFFNSRPGKQHRVRTIRNGPKIACLYILKCTAYIYAEFFPASKKSKVLKIIKGQFDIVKGKFLNFEGTLKFENTG